MFQRRFNWENEKVLMIRIKGCCNALSTVRKKGFLGKKKVVSKVKEKRYFNRFNVEEKTFLDCEKKMSEW